MAGLASGIRPCPCRRVLLGVVGWLALTWAGWGTLPGEAGELVVGEKVTYSGGPDQPPKEKDTGVSLKVKGVRGASTDAGPVRAIGGGDSAGAMPRPPAPEDAETDEVAPIAAVETIPDGPMILEPSKPTPAADDYGALLDAGSASEVFYACQLRDDPEGIAWQGLALIAMGRSAEAAPLLERGLAARESLPAALAGRLDRAAAALANPPVEP